MRRRRRAAPGLPPEPSCPGAACCARRRHRRTATAGRCASASVPEEQQGHHENDPEDRSLRLHHGEGESEGSRRLSPQIGRQRLFESRRCCTRTGDREGSRYFVDAAGGPRMTAAQPLRGQPAAANGAMRAQRLDGIFGAARPVAATRGQHRADRKAIKLDQRRSAGVPAGGWHGAPAVAAPDPRGVRLRRWLAAQMHRLLRGCRNRGAREVGRRRRLGGGGRDPLRWRKVPRPGNRPDPPRYAANNASASLRKLRLITARLGRGSTAAPGKRLSRTRHDADAARATLPSPMSRARLPCLHCVGRLPVSAVLQ